MMRSPRISTRAFLLLLLTTIFPPPTHALPYPFSPRQSLPDPGQNGTFQIAEGEYTLPSITVTGFPQPIELLATVVGPTGTSSARPLVLFLHGNHRTCYVPNPSDPEAADRNSIKEWPCTNGRVPFPSYRGYLQTQRLLATHGYLTVSISINGISAYAPDDEASGGPNFTGHMARSIMVRTHLSNWADWNSEAHRPSAPAIIRALAKADLSKVMLFGHSRGGEGVNRAAIDTISKPPASLDHPSLAGVAPRWTIRGLFLLGPTGMGQNPVPDVPSAVLLPGCDGDVYKLEGQVYVDGSRDTGKRLALHSSIFVEYANHEQFNSEWVYVPAVNNPYCRRVDNPNLLSPETQRAIGAAYVAAALRLFLAGDGAVRPFLDGSPVSPPPSVGSAKIHSHAIGANRLPLLLPTNITATASGIARICDIVPAPDSGNACGAPSSPHALSFQGIQPEPDRFMAVLGWTSAGATGTVRNQSPRSITGSTHVTLRVLVKSGTTGTRVQATLLGSNGARFLLGEFTLDGMPLSEPAAYAGWAQEVRFNLSGATGAGINLGKIAGIEFQSVSASGMLWMVDAWGWRDGSPDPQTPSAMPRVDMGEITVQGSASDQTHTLTVPVTGSASSSGKIRIFVKEPKGISPVSTNRVVDITSGMASFNVPVMIRGGVTGTYLVAAKTVKGALVGDPVGAIVVQ